MKLPFIAGKKKSVNLLPKDKFEVSTAGIVLGWALSFGKWAVIVTQVIVMAVFIARFGLDRKLADLRKEVAQSSAVIKSYQEVEQDFLVAQKSVEYASSYLDSWAKYQEMILQIESSTPSDVWYDRLSYTPENINISAYSSSLTGFGRFLTEIQRDPRYRSVNIGSIEDGSAKGARLKFDINLGIGGANGK